MPFVSEAQRKWYFANKGKFEKIETSIEKEDNSPKEKKEHMSTMNEGGKVSKVYLSEEGYTAFEIISEGKDLGLPPRDIKEDLDSQGIDRDAIRVGTKAHLLNRQGAEILKGKGPIVREAGWDSMSRLGDRD